MRKVLNFALPVVTAACVFIACLGLILILAVIVAKGYSAFSWKFLTQPMKSAGTAGGVFYHLLGTIILICTAAIVACPVSLGLAVTHEFYLNRSRWNRHITTLLHVLNGTPSILFGIFGFVVFVHGFGFGKSWLVGGMLLGFMIIPTIAMAVTEHFAAIPKKYFETGASLGLSKSQMILRIAIPQSYSGLITGTLLGLARAAGETAPIMFTATIFYGVTIPTGIKQNPVLSLPYHIFVLAQDTVNPVGTEKLWGSALVLVVLVISMSAMALPARAKIHEEQFVG